MSIYNCHKQQPQPWMSYIASNKPCYQGGCCPVLLTNNEDTVEVFTPTNGFLYNGLVALRDIAPAGWHVPTQAEWQTLETFLGGAAAAGGEMKEDGTTHWVADIGATNSSGFTALGSGRRDEAGNYEALFTEAFYWSSTVTGVHSMAYMTVIASTIVSHITSAWDIYGFSLRYIKDDTVDPGTLTGNNGIIYDTVTIGTQVWTVQNSAETRYRDGSLIEEISNQTEWIGLFRPAMCKYNNNEDYAGTTAMACATRLLPFQVISNGAFIQMEYTVYGEDTWTEIVIPYSEVVIDGFYFITYNGSQLSVCLDCGAYEFRLTAGEVWYFEAITIQEFANDEVIFTLHDPLMTPLKFSETLNECGVIIAPCDSFLPFMYSTENATTAPTYWLVNSEGVETELTDIVVSVLLIAGKNYYIHAGECFYPFLECGNYYLKIVDGTFTYYSVWFTAVCDMNDIPDGYRPMLDFNRCVMRDEEGEIMYEECSNIITVLLNTSGGATRVYVYDIVMKSLTQVALDNPIYGSADLAHTETKLWLYANTGAPLFASILKEWDLDLIGLTTIYNRSITGITASAGMFAIDNNTIITIKQTLSGTDRIIKAYETDISTGVAIDTYKFDLLINRSINGDYILTTTNKLIVTTYVSTVLTTIHITQYDYLTGNMEVDILISPTILTPYGLFEYNNEIYIVDWVSAVLTNVWRIDKNPPYAITLYDTLIYGMNGASQIASELTTHFST